jgi:hypothetical protein
MRMTVPAVVAVLVVASMPAGYFWNESNVLTKRLEGARERALTAEAQAGEFLQGIEDGKGHCGERGMQFALGFAFSPEGQLLEKRGMCIEQQNGLSL